MAAFGRALLTALAAVLFGLGWAAGIIAVAVLWAVAAIRVGWNDARRPPGERSANR